MARVIATSGPQQQDAVATLSSQEQAQETQSESESSNLLSGSTSGREFFYKMLLSVLLVIALGIGVIYVSRKLLPRFANLPGKQIRVLETAYIAPRKGLHLIQAGNRRLLVASTNETITMLADVTESAADFAVELEKRSQKVEC